MKNVIKLRDDKKLRSARCKGIMISFFNIGSFHPKDARKSDRSHQELSNEYLVAKVFFDTADNESS